MNWPGEAVTGVRQFEVSSYSKTNATDMFTLNLPLSKRDALQGTAAGAGFRKGKA
jgi:hypothetical protein